MGSGDEVGVPAPLCDCEYCLESDRRRRPCLLVEADGRRLVFDLGPDVTEQLHEVGVYDVDGFFATHAHYDHYWGVNELGHAAMECHGRGEATFDDSTVGETVPVYGSRSVKTFTEDAFPDVLNEIDYRPVHPGEAVELGDVTVTAFEVDHGTRAFPTQGYAVHRDETCVVYAPDVDRFPSVPDCCRDADVVFFEGSVLGGHPNDGADSLREDLDRIDGDRVVLTNVSEHALERHTDDIGDRTDYEIWADFDSAEV